LEFSFEKVRCEIGILGGMTVDSFQKNLTMVAGKFGDGGDQISRRGDGIVLGGKFQTTQQQGDFVKLPLRG